MPWAVKSAVQLGPYEADVRSHIFAIKTAAETAEEGMFYEEDGKTFARGKLTLDFACLWCHDGVQASTKTIAELAEVAPWIHRLPP